MTQATSEPYASPLLNRPGAAQLRNPGLLDADGVAWHYGNPLVEQQTVESGSGIVDLSHRRVIKVSGPQRLEFLNTLLSQKFEEDATAEGYAAQALDLDVQGRILHHMGVFVTADAVLLDVPSYDAQPLLDFLSRMIFWSQVQVSHTDLAIIAVLGTPLQAPEHAIFERAISPGAPTADSHSVQEICVEHADLERTVAHLEAQGGSLIGLMAYTAERVRRVQPERHVDLDSKSIAHEVPHFIGRGDLPGAVHLDKGCYRGQETVARVENIGRSPRLLVMLYLDGSAPEMPEPGAVITQGGRPVGRLGTVVDDCDCGPIALGLVKRSALPQPGVAAQALTIALESGDVAASVEEESLPKDEGIKAGKAAQERFRQV